MAVAECHLGSSGGHDTAWCWLWIFWLSFSCNLFRWRRQNEEIIYDASYQKLTGVDRGLSRSMHEGRADSLFFWNGKNGQLVTLVLRIALQEAVVCADKDPPRRLHCAIFDSFFSWKNGEKIFVHHGLALLLESHYAPSPVVQPSLLSRIVTQWLFWVRAGGGRSTRSLHNSMNISVLPLRRGFRSAVGAGGDTTSSSHVDVFFL